MSFRTISHFQNAAYHLLDYAWLDITASLSSSDILFQPVLEPALDQAAERIAGWFNVMVSSEPNEQLKRFEKEHRNVQIYHMDWRKIEKDPNKDPYGYVFVTGTEGVAFMWAQEKEIDGWLNGVLNFNHPKNQEAKNSIDDLLKEVPDGYLVQPDHPELKEVS